MDTSSSLKALILGLIEGATEFLPVSSTGHLIFFGDLIRFDEVYSEVFDVAIQSGALLAVILYYRRDFIDLVTFRNRNLLRSLIIAFFPIGIFGLLFGKFILENLFDTLFVGLAFIMGALLMLHVEFLHRHEKQRVESIQNISKNNALKIGLIQTLALIPGFSRSGAAIIGGMYFGLNRSTAANFSFLLAVPVILTATIYSLYLKFEEVNLENIQVFVVGFFTSFLSAFLVIKFLISYLKSHSLIVFAVYRILAGILIIFLAP
ncbi:undecaprenyl-diphosphate phosphatase [Betaproteobacteria bacterium]|nr:undecaprenyl-diphosphate phosphatase [Betaproteobacteria bacterium]